MPLVCCGDKLPDVPTRIGGLQIPDVDIQVNSVDDVADFVDVDKLSQSLDKVEAKLLSIVRAAVPEIKVELTKIDPDALGSDAVPGPVIPACSDVAEDCSGAGSRKPLFTRASLGYGNEDEAMQLTAASEDAPPGDQIFASRLEEGREARYLASEMTDRRFEDGPRRPDKINKLFAMPFVGALMSAACAVFFAVAGAGAILGPMLTAICAAVINSIAVAHAWRERAEPVFEVLSTQMAFVKNEILAVIDAVQPRLITPLQDLIATVDGMIEDQRPALTKMQELENVLDVDLPDPDMLKKPLRGCEEQIVDLVIKARKQIPIQIDALIDSSLAGRVISDRALFDRYVVRLPLLALLAVNLAVAMMQVMLPVGSNSQTSSVALHPTLRLLQDEFVSVNSSRYSSSDETVPQPDVWNVSEFGEDPQYWMSAQTVVPSFSSSFYSEPSPNPEQDDDEDEEFLATLDRLTTPEPSASLQTDTFARWAQNIEPVIVQVFLTLIQVAAAVVVSQGPRLCAVANRGIYFLQSSVNDKLNDCLKEAVDQVFGTAFGQVEKSSKQVFPKLKHALSKLKAALEAAAAAEKAVQGVGQLIDTAQDQ